MSRAPVLDDAQSKTGDIEMLEESTMKLTAMIKNLIREDGQDLVEYALVVALIAFAATAGMRTLATRINTTFTNISTSLSAA